MPSNETPLVLEYDAARLEDRNEIDRLIVLCNGLHRTNTEVHAAIGSLRPQLVEAQQRIAELEAVERMLREQMALYGSHRGRCNERQKVPFDPQRRVEFFAKGCTCGFTEACGRSSSQSVNLQDRARFVTVDGSSEERRCSICKDWIRVGQLVRSYPSHALHIECEALAAPEGQG